MSRDAARTFKVRERVVVVVAVVAFAWSISAQEQPQSGPNSGVQVGVPAGGRGGAPGGGAPGRGRRGGGPSKPAPRGADGRVLLGGATPKDKGVWLPAGVVTTSFTTAEGIPFQPWAKGLYADRQTHRLEPHARCKASGAVRQMQTPYGVEFVELPELQRMYIFDIGGPHTWREIYMDGRSHPKTVTPSYYGHSIGWWEGDTLVVDTVGYNEDFWFDRGGTPHTEQLHTLERFTRTNYDTIDYQVTIDDPATYTAPFTWSLQHALGRRHRAVRVRVQEQNYAGTLMVGASVSEGTVDRTSPFVP
jgi:hypothetical protein